jgi:hypothetical protein
MRILTGFALILCLACAAFAQPGAVAEKLKKAAEGAPGLPVRSNVFGSVTAQAVLIPAVDARRVFGKEIGDNYAVIQINVGNKSPDAALVVHNVFIDYSLWTLSGTRPDAAVLAAQAEEARGRFGAYQSKSLPNHIASEEYRVVRGQFLNAQTWKPRNKFLRLATLAGNIAAAYSFSISELGFNKGISAFNGVVLPGMTTAWPDTSLEQLNLINDLGFRTGQRVPKESAEAIVCFFPIDRFLTPGLKELFLKSPALFFAPQQMLVDRKLEKDVRRVLGDDLGLSREEVNARPGEDVLAALRRQLPCYLRVMRHTREVNGDPNNATVLGQIYQAGTDRCLKEFGLQETVEYVKLPDGTRGAEVIRRTVGLDKTVSNAAEKVRSFMALDYIAAVSLNNVGVTVDGTMSVDTTALAANIDNLQFDAVAGCGGPDTQCFWADTAANGGVRTATIRGSYLTGGSVLVSEDALGLTEFKTLDGATDQRLRFSFKLTQAVESNTPLHFKVTKPKGDGEESLDSEEFGYLVSYPTGPPRIDRAELSGDTLTVTGDNFFPNDLVVRLSTPDGEVLGEEDLTLKTTTTKKLSLDIPASKKAPGCWGVEVRYGTPPAVSPKLGSFAILPAPKVTDATVKAKEKQIVVTGEQLFDTGDCNGKPLYFQLVKEEPTDADSPILLKSVSRSAGKWMLELPAAANTGAWMVRGMLAGKKVGEAVKLKRP